MIGTAFAALPALAYAGVLDSLATYLYPSASAQVSSDGWSVSPTLSSQSMPLLQPAVNIDPNPAKGGGDIIIVDDTALLAEAGVEGTVVEASRTNGTISVYEVREGDSISQIATMFGVSVNTIKWANDIKGSIQPGDRLLILPISGVQYVAKKGDTLSKVAKLYDADADEIAQFNGLESGADLAVGTALIIPNADLHEDKPASSGSKSTTAKKAVSKNVGKTAAIGSGFFINPVPGALLTQGIHGYNAVDLGGRVGSPVYAAAGGTVILAKGEGWNGGYGLYIIVSHDNGTQTLYAHLSGVATSVGSTVAQGDLIGYLGNTGKSTGPHVHFEVRGATNPFSK